MESMPLTPEQQSRLDSVLQELLDVSAAERDPLIARLCAGDPVLENQVREDLALIPQAEDYFESLPTLQPGAERRAGAYRILKEIGRGGMGVVYLAERADGQFDRQVAVKVVSVLSAGGDAWRRFAVERRILASLDHPNIAQLYDAGATSDGAPYLAMELVTGEPVARYCDSRDLSVRDRLRLFLTVCDAVSYAHRNLVVHRDLKPSNILVTADGVVKLLDFGIAKVLAEHAAADVTVSGRGPMTMPFACPEQVRGEPCTTSWDIYSLGLVLYQLLAGRPAFAADQPSMAEWVRTVCETEAPPPSSVAASPRTARQLAGDLDNIVLKAIRKSPSERYASVPHLAADLENYLAGRPVSAVAPSKLYRLRKWASRHRWSVASGSAAALLLLAATGTALWQARAAKRERAQSQHRFEQVRGLARAVMWDLHDAIAPLAGSTAARKVLVDLALTYLSTLASDAGNDAGLQVEVADGYLRLGRVQGDMGGASLGDTTGALATLGKARQALQAVLAREPGHAQAERLLADVLRRTARIHAARFEFQQSLQFAQESVALAERLAAQSPQDDGLQRDLAASYAAVAVSLQTDPAGQARVWHKVLALWESDVARHSSRNSSIRDVAETHRYLANCYLRQHMYRPALDHANQALKLDEDLLVAEPGDIRHKVDVSFDLSMLATIYIERKQFQEALPLSERVLSIRQELAAADPNDVRMRGRVAYAHLALGAALDELRQYSRARAQFADALRVANAILKNDPGQGYLTTYVIDARVGLGNIWAAEGNRRRACEELLSVAPHLRDLRSRDAGTAVYGSGAIGAAAGKADACAKLSGGSSP